MSNPNAPLGSRSTLDLRSAPAETVRPAGNQSANIRLTTRRHRHARHHPREDRTAIEAASTTTVLGAASPCPLDKPAYIAGLGLGVCYPEAPWVPLVVVV